VIHLKSLERRAKDMSINSQSTEMSRQTVIALFATRGDADQGITRLMNVGVEPGHIGLLEPRDAPRHTGRRQSIGVVLGGLAGAIVGGVFGAYALGLTGLGWTLVAAVTGIAIGSYVAALFGSFFGGDGGHPDEPYFVRAIQDGRILVSAEVPDRAGENSAVAVLHESSALEVDSLGTGHLRLQFRHPLEEVA
jgi:hypothetical protein